MKEELDLLVEQYNEKFDDDLFFKSLYNDDRKNIKQKIAGLKWCLSNDKRMVNYENYEKVFPHIDFDIRWDL